jgi:hypothetical protein
MDTLVSKAKQELIEYVDMLNITNSNYDDILNLVLNADDALFTKIIEEIKDGNLQFNDFQRMFSFDGALDDSISEQAKLYREHQLLSERLYEAAELANIDRNRYLSLLHRNFITNHQGTHNGEKYDAAEIEKENKLISMLTKEGNDVLEEHYKNKMLNQLIAAPDNERAALVDSMLFSLNDYLVPVDFDHIELTDTDIQFARENNMTDDDMRKMKSFAAYLSTFE